MGLLEKQQEDQRKESAKFSVRDIDFLLKLINESSIKGSELQQAVQTVLKLQAIGKELSDYQLKPH